MNWLQKIAAGEWVSDDKDHEDAMLYYSIGHGDFDEEVGFKPKYIVWTYLGGSIQTGPEGYGDGVIQESDEDLPHGGTHGSLWGHDTTFGTYKGRYEPETGQLSIVKPAGKEYFSIPEIVMQALYSKFKNITKVVEF